MTKEKKKKKKYLNSGVTNLFELERHLMATWSYEGLPEIAASLHPKQLPMMANMEKDPVSSWAFHLAKTNWLPEGLWPLAEAYTWTAPLHTQIPTVWVCVPSAKL